MPISRERKVAEHALRSANKRAAKEAAAIAKQRSSVSALKGALAGVHPRQVLDWLEEKLAAGQQGQPGGTGSHQKTVRVRFDPPTALEDWEMLTSHPRANAEADSACIL